MRCVLHREFSCMQRRHKYTVVNAQDVYVIFKNVVIMYIYSTPTVTTGGFKEYPRSVEVVVELAACRSSACKITASKNSHTSFG